MGPDAAWIFWRESTWHTWARNSSSGAYGLGQLTPQTYRDLHLTPSSNACDQVEAARRYMVRRYHTWLAARHFWNLYGYW